METCQEQMIYQRSALKNKKFIKIICLLCQKNVWKTKKLSVDWHRAILLPQPKKANIKACKSNKTISLICHETKIPLKIIEEKMKGRLIKGRHS